MDEPSRVPTYYEQRPRYNYGKLLKISMIVIIVAGLAFLGSVYFKKLPTIGNIVLLQKCPHDCCEYGFDLYELKDCPQYYFCQNHNCLEKDSDSDGLTDGREAALGTNLFNSDTDGDWLADGEEVNIYRTNPLKANSDCDRYSDYDEVKQSTDPLKANSAIVTSQKSDEVGEYNAYNIVKDGLLLVGTGAAFGACESGSFGACSAAAPAVAAAISWILNDVIYTTKTDVYFVNSGNDYSSYVNYDVVYYTGGVELNREHRTQGRIDVNGALSDEIKNEILLKDVPISIWDFIINHDKVSIEIENIDYQKYPSPC